MKLKFSIVAIAILLNLTAIAQEQTGLLLNDSTLIPEAAHKNVLDLTDALTLEAWIKLTVAPGREMRIIDKYHNNVSSFDIPGGGYALGITKDNKLWMTAGRSSVTTSSVLPLGKWVHVLGTFSIKEELLKLYVDGREAGSNGKPGMMNILKTHIPLRIGADWEAKLRFDGAINRVALYNRSLSKDEIESLASNKARLSVIAAGKVADWPMADGKILGDGNIKNLARLQFTPGITGAKTNTAKDNLLWYDKPAQTWTEALPIGNGRLGAMVFGKPGHERLQLNETTVWSGKPEPDADRPNAYKALPEIRKALRDGNYEVAQSLTAKYISTNNPEGGRIYNSIYFASYETLGDLNFDFKLDDGTVTNYQRWLDIDRAISGVSFTAGSVNYKREIFSSAPAGVIVMKITGDKKGSVNFSVNLSRLTSANTSFEAPNTLVMKGNSDLYDRKGNVDYEARVKLLAPTGKVTGTGDELTVSGANEAVIIIGCATSYVADYDKNYKVAIPHDALVKKIAAASSKAYALLQHDHVADYQKYFYRVTFSLGNLSQSQLPTDQRLAQYGDGDKDQAMVSLFYQYGRYLMISSSRPDNPLPSNSQGIWGDGLKLPWHADYKSNINYQMNYWGVESGNLSEMHLPMINLNRGLVKPGRKTARAYFNAPGWVMAMMTNPWGWTSPGESPSWGAFFGGGGWVCQHLWEHYAFTRDREYLKSVYPTLKEACEFYLAVLVEDRNGFLITAPSTSPENTYMTPAGFKGNVMEGGAIEREIIWDLFQNTMSAARILKRDDDFYKQLETVAGKIRPLQIGKAGQLMEWGEDWDLQAPEIHHRHVSHLFALYPGHQVTPVNTPELAAAARKSLEIRGDDGTGWSLAWKINFWARLLDGDHALTLINKQLRYVNTSAVNMTNGGGTYANLFDAHPPFQIDGNFGFISGIDEMLLQSHENYKEVAHPGEDKYTIQLLPALPSAWPEGNIKGLRARGGYEISMNWKSGKLVTVSVMNIAGTGGRLRYGSKSFELGMAKGVAVVLDGNLELVKGK